MKSIEPVGIRHKRNKFSDYFREIKKHYWLYIMLALPIAFYILFAYMPMGGVVIAFQEYNIFKGIRGSEFVGLQHFRQVFSFKDFWFSVRNMLVLNVISLMPTEQPKIPHHNRKKQDNMV